MMIQGKGYWARITGNPHNGYKSEAPQDRLWSFDLSIADDVVQKFKAAGIADKIKNKNDERGNFVTWKRKAIKKDGMPAKPIRVVDRAGQPWDPAKKIGNGSTLNVQFIINDEGSPNPRPSVLAVQVWELVEYEGGGGGDFEEFPVDASGEEKWA
jgi:hypothetical protein